MVLEKYGECTQIDGNLVHVGMRICVTGHSKYGGLYGVVREIVSGDDMVGDEPFEEYEVVCDLEPPCTSRAAHQFETHYKSVTGKHKKAEELNLEMVTLYMHELRPALRAKLYQVNKPTNPFYLQMECLRVTLNMDGPACWCVYSGYLPTDDPEDIALLFNAQTKPEGYQGEGPADGDILVLSRYWVRQQYTYDGGVFTEQDKGGQPNHAA